MFRTLFVLIPLLLVSTSLLAKDDIIPLDYFSHLPMVEKPTLSPDGKNIAAILNQGDVTTVALTPFENKSQVKVLLQLGGEKYRIEEIYWANNERILVSVSQPLRIKGWAVKVRSTHLYSAKIDGSEVIELRKSVRSEGLASYYRNSPNLLSLLEKEPNHILITMRDKRDGYYRSVFKVNINNGEFVKYLANSNRIVGWGVTDIGEVLLGVGVHRNYKFDTKYIYTRENVDADWKMVKSFEEYKTETFEVIQYEPKSNSIVVISDYKLNKKALWRFDIASGNYTLMGEAPGMLDVTDAITRLEGAVRTIVGYTYNDNFVRRIYFSDDSSRLSDKMAKYFNSKNLRSNIYDWDKNKQRYIISVVGDNSPGKFYLFDRQSNNLGFWYAQFPNLENVELAKVQPFDFEARDGMKLHGYLTLPNNAVNPPVVLFPHGGPFGRDSQYFDPYVQMMASRGYAVLQVNYRGSTGYGNKYYTAGYHQWGKKMQSDLIDAIAWLKNSKQADTENACIIGFSYGGYAALAAGFQTPSAFKCIVSIAGVANMKTTLAHWKLTGNRNYIENAVTSDQKELKNMSPVNHAREFEAPVLLIHGKNDGVVNYRESEEMYDKLRNAKKNVNIKLFKYGTHDFDDSISRKSSMELIASFLDKHLH